MKKRIISLVVAVILVLALAPYALAVGFTEIALPYDNAGHIAGGFSGGFSEGLLAVSQDGRWGFVDTLGNEVVPPMYDRVWGFSDGLAMVTLNGRLGFIDRLGNEVVPLKYDVATINDIHAGRFIEGLAAVRLNDRWGFINTSGNVVIPFIYDSVAVFSNGRAQVLLNGRSSFIDKSGNEVIQLNNYNFAGRFSEGLAEVSRVGGMWGFIDTSGNEVIPLIYNLANPFSEGLAAVRHDFVRWSLINTSGNVVAQLNHNYNFVGLFSYGRAGVMRDGRQGFIDRLGNEVIPVVYDSVREFSNGFARVERDGKWGLIDTLGNEVVPPRYDLIQDNHFSEGFAVVGIGDINNRRFGLIDRYGNEVIPVIYNSIRFSEGVAVVSLDGNVSLRVMGATGTQPTTPAPTQNISVTLNGTTIQFDQPPIMQDGRTLVPLRAIFEALGADVEWDGVFQMVTATRGDTVVRLQIGNAVMTVNGENIPLDVPAQIVNDRTLVPARAIAESFGADVQWDGAMQTVIITN
ncbi:MAG: WG repeat-containing protein [Oscillospiraceae bacterium]|nr:WG repeat-containing protein [Oscillospiraceae bacterium]